ncbi:MAG: hypothetical protein AAB691_01600 [Patescibacteria group bacterium]
MVNGDWVLARQFDLHLRAAEEYEKNTAAATSTPSVLKDSNLVTAVLEGLIEEKLIERGARREFSSELEARKKELLASFLKDNPITGEEGARYGMKLMVFEQEILLPQITRDLLAGRLYLQSLRLEDWLTFEKKNARVSIFSKVFTWDGGSVKTK